MNSKNAILLFALYMIINSDTFIKHILSNVSGTLIGTDISTFGACIQAVFLIISYTLLLNYMKK